MHRPVIAIGLDAFSPILLENWVREGKLPTFARLLHEGTYARQRNYDLYRTENSWLTLLQGCSPEVSHEWGHQDYQSGAYAAVERAAYTFDRYPPFYALPGRRVAVFDIPLVGVVEGVDGVQLSGWGTEANQIIRESSPRGAIGQIVERHGRHPLYDTITETEDGKDRLSYRIPSVYDLAAMRAVRDKLVSAVRTRTAIIKELMAAEAWDLLLCVYAESHTAGHLLWHFGQVHPLRALLGERAGEDMFLEVAEEIDAALAELIQLVPADAELLLFSPHGMRPNPLDLNSMLFLPEIVYRWATGQQAFEGYGTGAAVPAPRLDYRKHWREEVWAMRTPHGGAVLESPFAQEDRGDPLDWDPANWYRPLWAKMSAFCLPGYSEGLVRINVNGRDGENGIDPDGFDRICNELAGVIGGITDARTGEPIVDEIIRVRAEPFANPEGSPADLIVRWRDHISCDVVDHASLGRIGPAPFFRTGGHAVKGFVLARGPSFASGQQLPDVKTEDVTATILDRLEVERPAHMIGRPMERVT